MALLAACSADDPSDDPVVTATGSPTTSASRTPEPTSTPTSSPTTPGPPDPGDATRVSVRAFATPSGNIRCSVEDDGDGGLVDCVITSTAFPLPSPSEPCDVDWSANEVTLQPGRVPSMGVCRGDPPPAYLHPERTTLAYDTLTVVDDFRCLSRRSSLTCWHSGSGHGFELAREAFTPF
ncbi:hypothetical protein G7075_18515 [Phycicoccus sp. HDW14]|uniref:DUF6636 domain-containing protein n=1 Tax=Phycicoccus sp. HDW14 TaxID=2714941 RepID=UPI00140965F7|nr:DUF6636 domain-containing protein [Phycicoccus sp. HDW14]QIM22667.1 hypothetical protein G7075_18515 [Phycicoccus sp. HDW14]